MTEVQVVLTEAIADQAPTVTCISPGARTRQIRRTSRTAVPSSCTTNSVVGHTARRKPRFVEPGWSSVQSACPGRSSAGGEVGSIYAVVPTTSATAATTTSIPRVVAVIEEPGSVRLATTHRADQSGNVDRCKPVVVDPLAQQLLDLARSHRAGRHRPERSASGANLVAIAGELVRARFLGRPCEASARGRCRIIERTQARCIEVRKRVMPVGLAAVWKHRRWLVTLPIDEVDLGNGHDKSDGGMTCPSCEFFEPRQHEPA